MSWRDGVRLSILVLLMTACGSGSPPTKTATVQPAGPLAKEPPMITPPGIEFFIEPDDAEVYVDGEFLGNAGDVAADGVLKLSPGLHQIMIRHDVLKTYRVEVSIGDTTEKITVNLEAAEQ